MQKIFNYIGSLIERKPFRSLIVTLLVIVGMLAGVSQMRLATGNETLVQVNNSVYISNQTMEDSFGGDSILILFEAENKDTLLNVENINKMYSIEKRLVYEENIFNVISPATIAHQISLKQAEKIIENVGSISSGLNTMGLKMQEIGEELLLKDIKDPKEILLKLDALSSMSLKFNQLASAQTQMSYGISQIESGLNQVSDGLSSISNQLVQLANTQSTEPLKTSLLSIATNLSNTSINVRTIGDNTQNLQDGTASTATALTTIGSTLTQELGGMKDSLSTAISPTELKNMANGFVSMGKNLIGISSGLNTFQQKSTMFDVQVPRLDEELKLVLYENNVLRTAFKEVIINDNQAMMIVKLQGNLEDAEKERLTDIIISTVNKAGFTSLDTTISGKTVLDIALKTEMKTSMITMIALAILIMFGVLLLVFKVKWRMLSLAVIFISVIATLGFMSWIKVPVTMVSMAVFPILIGLGIDYSIQFHNRYVEEQSVSTTLKQIGKSVAIAVFATVLGFISLYISPVPMIQDFGKMLTIGVMVSFLGSIFLLLPIIQIGKQTNTLQSSQNDAPIKESKLEHMFIKLTRLTIKLSIPILVAFTLIASYGIYVDQFVGIETDIETFMPQDLPELIDIQKIRNAVQTTDQIILYLEDDSVISESNLNWIDSKLNDIQDKYSDSIVSIKSISSLLNTLGTTSSTSYNEKIDLINDLPDAQRSMFINDEYNQAVILINIKHLSTEESRLLLDDLSSDLSDSPMKIQLTGKTVMDIEMVKGLTSGRISMTLLGIALVFFALLIIYRNFFKALVPIIPVIMIIGISSLVMVWMNIDFTPITATLGALVLGMGSEMSIMVMERYVEERENGLNKNDAIILSIQRIGKAILASGLTTIGGFSVLLFSSFIILKDFGFMTVINISLALISTFIVLPPLILLFDSLLIKKEIRNKQLAPALESETTPC
jgi:hydrophobe/amphiphile efflux-3 (HAE3) family protein